MEFVWMTHEGVERPAPVPESAVPHWEGNGWVRTDPPPRRTYRKPVEADAESAKAAASAVLTATSTAPPTDPPAGAKSKSTTKAAPSGRKEE